MLAEILQDRAALYVSGAMTATERDSFEILLEFHQELQQLVAGLQEVVTDITLAESEPKSEPPAALKSRLLQTVVARPPQAEPDALVVTNARGLVEWINPAFTIMCGYSLEELKGRKPGALLQGPETDPATVARIRSALLAREACRETILNYHKDGTRYRAEVNITPILDDTQSPLWFVARERRLPEMSLAPA